MGCQVCDHNSKYGDFGTLTYGDKRVFCHGIVRDLFIPNGDRHFRSPFSNNDGWTIIKLEESINKTITHLVFPENSNVTTKIRIGDKIEIEGCFHLEIKDNASIKRYILDVNLKKKF